MRAAAGALVLLAFVSTACAANPSGESEPRAPRIEAPGLEAFDAETREQFREQFERLESFYASERYDAEFGNEMGKLGQLLLAYLFPDSARRALQAAESFDPGAFAWPYYLGYLEQQEGNYEDSIWGFRRALELDPTHVAAWMRLAQVAQESGQAIELARAVERLEQLAPDEPLALFLRGQAATRAGDHAAALAHYEAALAGSPQSSAVHYQIARAYQALGDNEKARTHMALRGEAHIPPPDALVYELWMLKRGVGPVLDRASRLMEAGRFEEAAVAFEEVVTLAPDDITMWLNYGAALGQLGRDEDARGAFESALAIDPEHPRVNFNLAILDIRDGYGERALERLVVAVRGDPGNTRALRVAAELYRRSGRCAEAVPYFERVLQSEPADGASRRQLAMCFITEGRSDEVVALLEAGYDATPNDPAALDALARVLSTTAGAGNGARAVALAERISAVAGAAGRETLAMSMAATGRFDEAIQLQEALIGELEASEQTPWREHLQTNLERYRIGQRASTPWPSFMLGSVTR